MTARPQPMDDRPAMEPYYCIISTADEPVADLCVLQAVTDPAALQEAREIARGWSWLDRIQVYQGERRVAVLDYARSSEALRQAA